MNALTSAQVSTGNSVHRVLTAGQRAAWVKELREEPLTALERSAIYGLLGQHYGSETAAEIQKEVEK